MKHSFRRRLFAAMLLASLLPLLLCTVLMVQITRLRMQNKAREDLGEQSAILCQSLSSLRDAMVQSSDKLREDDSVIHALGSGTGSRFQINSLLFTATDSWRTIGVFDLYDSTGVCRYSTRGTVSQNLPTDWGVLYGAAQADGEPVYYAAENPADMTSPLLLGGVALRAEDGCGGFLVMRVYAAGFHALLDGKYVQSDVLVLSKFFRPIYGSQTSLTQVLAPQLRQTLLAGEAPTDSNYVYKIVNHPETGLNLVLRQPQMFTSRTVWLLYTAGVICVLACVCVSALVSLPISRQIAAPLERLMTGFRRVQQDNLEIQIPVDRQDEFGELAEQFNQTVRALNTNRAELLRNQQELNQAQIRMMQAQLNPHFLCNTLDTMKWISKINKVPQVAMMATNLADILRLCISPEEFVPLYREMEILQRYIEIQKVRLGDDFAFRVSIPEELYDCMVPKMILQPIVENAILHGIDGMTGAVISVQAQTDGNQLKITVRDNGRGFPADMLGQPYRRDKGLAKGHLGLYNVDMILRGNFGERGGLWLSCGEDGGAVVTALLPVRYDTEL